MAFDLLVAEGATTIFEETGELIGMEHLMAARAANPALGGELKRTVAKAAQYYATLGYASFAPGNADGGLTTIEEKSLGAYAKSGQSRIDGIVKPGIEPAKKGLYLLDVVPDGEVRFGFPNINDNAEIAELIACGSQVILFSTGRGSVVGSAIAPVIKVCANPQTYQRMQDDMDVDAGRILEGRATLPEVGREIYELIRRVGNGEPTKSGEPGPPGIHPDVQELRAARAGVPAGLRNGQFIMSRLLSTIGVLGTLVWVGLLVVLFGGRVGEIASLQPNQLGDFLAGVFGPIAILWLILGFFQQQAELRQNSRALDLQAEELKSSTREQRELLRVMRAQLEATQAQVALDRERAATDEPPAPRP